MRQINLVDIANKRYQSFRISLEAPLYQMRTKPFTLNGKEKEGYSQTLL